MSTRLIIPGLNGSGPGHWQDHWLGEDPDAVLVKQDDWSRPDLGEWLIRLEIALRDHPGATLVAHSFGALVAANLAGRPSAALVGAALLVAPCDPDRVRRLHPGAVGAAALPCAPASFPTTVVGSRNDPYMPLDDARSLADGLNGDFVDLGHAGHININSGHGSWPAGYRLAQRLEDGGRRILAQAFAAASSQAAPAYLRSQS
ncbi:putative alpha/beta hydrolase family esterase [Rhizobium sp. SG_E_25_P2]|uniref:RBBP9/YdeN family alpha/beta hydrolase n=1 Tax=Rhizobium sp. SG_E_25_P2 TaxID=2879942 RepID=UPI002473C474|nr:alpha/beta hydrolase [Rhizobium sp. SG_E_25_P2]MDH6265701.1 putative alpha/beta hydrolase family esterase [Rhizobium sp. SG_E_25_P2]